MTCVSPGQDEQFPAVAALGLACVAIAGPTLIAFNVPPSATFFNQAATLVGWGCWLSWVAATSERSALARSTGLVLLQTTFALLMLAATVAPMWASLPRPLALSSAGMIAAA